LTEQSQRLVVGRVRFVTPEVALVDATVTQFGPVAWRRDPLLFFMRKQGTEWQVVSIRMLSADR
jgi:ABC-type phosphate transport system ATPase subunit